jgi:membrane dipeptidase
LTGKPTGPPIVIDAAAPAFRSRWREWRKGGVTGVLATVALEEGTSLALTRLGEWLQWVRSEPDELRLALTAADLAEARQAGRTAVVVHFQSARAIGYDAGLIEVFYRAAVRVMQIAYNVRGPLGDGILEPTDGGLSRLGVRAVAEMNRVGMLVDLSHAGVRTSLEAISASARAAVFTHSNARGVCDHPRNLTDEQIKAVAAAGGVIGVNAYPNFVKARGDRLTVDDLIDHVAYIADLVGVEHVGIGLDFFDATPEEYSRLVETGIWSATEYPPPPYRYPVGIADAAEVPSLQQALLRRGFPDQAVAQVLGANFLRVFEQVWG